MQWPFEVTECGWGEFQAKISLHFKDKDQQPVEALHVIKLHWSDPDASGSLNLEPRKAPDGSLLPVVHEQYDEVKLENVNTSRCLSSPATCRTINCNACLPYLPGLLNEIYCSTIRWCSQTHPSRSLSF